MSVNVTGDCACGTDGGGSFAGPDELYDLPVRAGAGEAAGCWHKTVGVAVNNRKDKTSRDAVSWASSCRKLIYGSYQQHKHDAFTGGCEWIQRFTSDGVFIRGQSPEVQVFVLAKVPVR